MSATEQFQLLLSNLGGGHVPAILIDLDGVIIDNSHRLHHIVKTVDGKQTERHDADWAAFHAAAPQDTAGVFAPIITRLIRFGVYAPIFLSARIEIESGTRERILNTVRSALNTHTLPDWSLILREQGSKEPPPQFKGRIIDAMQAAGIEIAFALDDSHANCLQFKGRGIPTLRAYNHLADDAYHY